MATSILKQSVVSYFEKGTWVPHIYDLDTKKAELGDQTYFRIGDIYIMYIECDFPNVTFSTMMQIRNLPCTVCFGGALYYGGATDQFGQKTIQGTAGRVYIRPNVTGTYNGGIFTAVLIGCRL